MNQKIKTILFSVLIAVFLLSGVTPSAALPPAAVEAQATGSAGWNTFFGGLGEDSANATAVDAAGNIYVTGSGDDWAGAPLPAVNAYTAGMDAFVAKFDPSGVLVWYTFLGGAGDDYGMDLALDSIGNIYVTGSSTLAWGGGAGTFLQPVPGGSANTFVVKLEREGGELVWHTFAGYSYNNTHPNYIALYEDETHAASIFVTGSTAARWGIDTALNLPQPGPGEPQLGNALFVVKLNSSGDLQWHTFWGGADYTWSSGIALDSSGNVYLAGWEIYSPGSGADYRWHTSSGSFVSPVTGEGIGPFVARLDGSGQLAWYTFHGGQGGNNGPIALDSHDDVYRVAGSLITKINQDGYPVALAEAGTSMGAETIVTDMVLDAQDNIYLSGTSTASWGMPVTPHHPGDPFHPNPSDAFAAKFDSEGKLLWNTFRGSSPYLNDGSDSGTGLALHLDGTIILTGTSSASWGLPVSAYNAYGTPAGNQGFLAKINFVYGQPLVIVHGWTALPFQAGDNCEQGIQRYNGQNSTMAGLNAATHLPETNSIADWLEGLGYEVWLAHWTTSTKIRFDADGHPHLIDGGTPTIQTNANCVKDQITKLAGVNQNPITIVAHSTGGLVSRVVIKDLHRTTRTQIKALFTLGTPHAGVPLYTDYLCWADEAGCQMSPGPMAKFNKHYVNIPTANYTFIGGIADGGTADYVSAGVFGAGPNDGFVSKYSAVGWSILYVRRSEAEGGRYVGFTSNWASSSLFSDFTQFWTDEYHAEGLDHYGAPPGDSYIRNYYSHRSDDSVSHAFGCIRSQLLEEPSPPAYCSTPTLDHWPQEFFLGNSPAALTDTERKAGHLNAGQSVSVPLAMDTNGPSTFGLSWSGNAVPTFTLTSPNNQLIDSVYAAAHPDEVIYRANSDALSASSAYIFTSTQPGIWQLNITTDTLPLDYRVVGTLTTERLLSIQTDSSDYHIGDTATFTAHLEDSGVGLPGATVTAVLTRLDGVADTIPLMDQGDGSYSALYTIPAVPGFATLQVIASGSDSGIPFSRQQLQVIEIASSDLQLTGIYSEIPLDNDGDGLYETLDFNAGVNLAAPGQYEVSADLYAGDQFVAHSSDNFDLQAGSQTITLPFDGLEIGQAGLDGPYIVTRFFLIPVDLGVASQDVSNVLTTAAYTYTQFGKVDYTISGNAGVPEAVLDYVDGRSKRVAADENGNYSFTVPYHWSGTVTPYKMGYTFTPAGREYASLESNQNGQDYSAIATTYALTGNTGLGGVTLTYTPEGGSPQTIISDSQGNYSLTLPFGWEGRIVPSLSGYVFRPDHISYSLFGDGAFQDYVPVTATPITYTISGFMVGEGGAGVTLSYTDGTTKTATTDSIGNYSFTVSYNWSGTVTPSKAGYTFSPANRTYTNLTADQSNQYYYPVVSQYLISGNAGAAGATLNYYIDGVAKAATSDASGNYGFTVPYNWSGTVTPSKTGVAFTPASLSYYNVTASQSAQNYAGILTYISAATHDGWVLESAEASGVGGTMNNTANVFQLGDDAANRQYRSILSFNTGSLPNTAVIQSVVLKIKQNGTPVGTNPFTALGSLRVDIRQGAFGTGNALELADFNAAASALAVGTFNETPVGGWYSATLNATGRSYINDAGYTQLRLRFSTDDNNNLAADFMRFLSGDYTSGQPELIITYTLP